MINFFWQFFALFGDFKDGVLFLLLGLIVAIPWTLGFLFSALHA